MQVYKKNQIEEVLDIPALLEEIEKGLVLYSEKKVHSAPVGFLHFDKPLGDVHIKSSGINGEELFVIKIASGFYDNPKMGLPSSNGLMLLFSQNTGILETILLDEGMLTDIRTALAGAICAKYLAPKKVTYIGIVGTGTQAKMQLLYLQHVCPYKEVIVWGRNREKALNFSKDPAFAQFNIHIADNLDYLAEKSNLIVTTTPSRDPLLFSKQIKPGTHITAVGADDEGKQELDPNLFLKANTIVADSISQCFQYGDLSYAKDLVDASMVFELGNFIKLGSKRKEQEISIADLTGLGIEDLQIAKYVYKRLKENEI